MTAAANTGAGGSFESDAVGVSTSFESVMEGGEVGIGDKLVLVVAAQMDRPRPRLRHCPQKEAVAVATEAAATAAAMVVAAAMAVAMVAVRSCEVGNDSSTAFIPLPQLEHQAAEHLRLIQSSSHLPHPTCSAHV